jgi:hypothetical protein
MIDFKFLLPYILEHPIFPEYSIKEASWIQLGLSSLLEIQLKNFRPSLKTLNEVKGFYNVLYCGDTTYLKFKIPEHVLFVCEIIKKFGVEYAPKSVFVSYLNFWKQKKGLDQNGQDPLFVLFAF